MEERRFSLSVLFVWLILLSYCSNSGREIELDEIPYESENTLLSNLIGERYHLDVESYLIEAALLNGIFSSVYPPEPIDAASSNNGDLILFLRSEETLVKVDPEDNINIIASPGRGPNSIESGIKLIQSVKHPILLQRNRVSSISCASDCSLNVMHSIDEYFNYYNFTLDGKIIVNGYNPFGGNTIQVKDQDLQSIKSFGEFFRHSNPSYVRHFNFSSIELSADQRYLVHLFSDFPTVAIYELETFTYKSFSIHEFYHHAMSSFSSNSSEVEIDYQKRHSQMFNINQYGSDKFLITVKHRRELERARGFTASPETYFYDYYILSIDDGFSYAGSSTDVIVPIDSRVIFHHDFLLYKLDIPFSEMAELQKKSNSEFNLPELF